MIPKKNKKNPFTLPFTDALTDPQKSTMLEEKDILAHHIDEIKSMRDEIGWRVKNAYTASIVFLSAITLAGSTFFGKETTFFDQIKEPEIMTKTGIAAMIVISAWVGVQNANHLIEKRIELYTLTLMKEIHKTTGHIFFSWLGFLYGSTFFKNPLGNGVSKFLNASIGMFIYLLPNVVAIAIFVLMLVYANVRNHIIFFSFASAFLLVSAGTTLFFFFYVVKINKEFTSFYKDVMEDYFKEGLF